MIFEPREVPIGNVKIWFVEALELSRRKLIPHIILTLGLYAVTLIDLGDMKGLVFAIVFPVMLAIGCAIAKSADESLPAWDAISKISGRAWLRCATAAAIPWMGLVVLGMLALIFGDGSGMESRLLAKNEIDQERILSTEQMVATLAMIVILIFSMIYMMLRMTCLFWFLWTLCVIADLPLVEAFDQALDAVTINRFVVWPYAIASFALILFPFFLGSWAIYPWIAITCSMLYTSYRDVWLHRSQNYPARKVLAHSVTVSRT